MSESFNNPRRAPRAMVECDARVALRDGRYFTSATHDCGPQGCQLVSPTPLCLDERVFVELRGTGVAGATWVSGRIAWVASAPPYRAGVRFDAGCSPEANGFFVQLADANPEATCGCVQAVDLPDTALLLSARRSVDEALLPGEGEVLRAVGEGIRVDELRARLGDRWDSLLNPIFSLVARGELRVKAEPAEPNP